MNRQRQRNTLRAMYRQLYAAFGPQHWWPADSPFEVVIGAILTQNTSWKNVEKALGVLKEKKLLDPVKLYKVDERLLAHTIISSGFFNIKAKRIKQFIQFLFIHYQGSLERMFSEQLTPLRENLLRVKGIGPETADSILLYAGGMPIFVVDAYTRRVLLRHRLISDDAGYGEVQELFMKHLKKDVQLFNEFHALLVHVGKHFCKRISLCEGCPLKDVERKK